MPAVFEAVKDQSGKTVSFQGITINMLEWLSKEANFTYVTIITYVTKRVKRAQIAYKTIYTVT